MFNNQKKKSLRSASKYSVKAITLYKPIDSNVAKPYEQWELSQGNKEQEIVVFARIITPDLCKKDSLHCFHQEYSHT